MKAKRIRHPIDIFDPIFINCKNIILDRWLVCKKANKLCDPGAEYCIKNKRKNMLIKKRIISNDTNKPITINADKIGKRYMKNGCMYNKYHSCTKCKNASWYDDDYCNNQHIHFIDKENVKTTQVYCENYEVKNAK